MQVVTRAIRIKWIVCIIAVLSILAAGNAWAERVAISVEVANIRSGPGTDYQQLWRVEKYTPLEVISKQGDWVFFKDFEGTRGWIHGSLVGNIPAVITKKDMCNIRSGPGTDQQVRFQAETGVPFKVLERKGNWIHIQHADGEKGWIYNTLVW